MIAQSTFILSFFLIGAVSSVSGKCSTSSCDANQTRIRFPFRLTGVEPDRCRGYPGFDQSCDDSSRFTILRLSNSSFRVQNIDYGNQQIWLNDPNQCLSRLLQTLNLSGTPFRPVFTQELALFNCSSNSSIAGFDRVPCLGDVNDRDHTVFATESPATLSPDSVPAAWPPSDGKNGRSSVVPEEIRLTWDEPRCGGCEARGGVCGLKPDSNHDIQCKIPGKIWMHLTTFALGFVILVALFVVIKVCRYVSGRYGGPETNPWLTLNPMAATPHAPARVSGLDQTTIDSFLVTVLGESVRISRTENNVCAICLGEYKPKDSLRTIPVCHHFFHSDCIDEWLHRNSTCPICRESQIQLPVSDHAPDL